ncbi:MAG: dapA [candidate division NC10 bacterium]|jgi:dihydrodipicolinate synthase/N-acetylneuraminate lyase|nr:dapA [candidate division NC10 bacterium]
MKAHGIIVALHTPLTPSGEIHEEALRDHLEWMVRSGIHGIFPCGTMGEGIALSDAQRKRVAEITVDQVKHRAFVMPQVTTNNTAGGIELSRHAKAVGADAISVIAPYFYPSDGPALDAFFGEIAASVPDMPVFLYNNPGRSASGISSSLVGKLVKKVKNIAGIKDSSKDLILFQEYVEVGGEGFACIIGTDGLVYPAMMVGGVGVVSAVANPFPELMVALYDAVIAKQYERARKLQLLVNQLRVVLKIGPYLAGYKEIMRLRGRQFPLDMKAPLRGLNEKETAEIHAAFASLPKAVFDPSLVQ